MRSPFRHACGVEKVLDKPVSPFSGRDRGSAFAESEDWSDAFGELGASHL